ncbi:unnamed protein product [Staurois parvus]|uniref:Uncharacterized protein n=1 Tax=Staurois parvus TaxID=386267 RepID=A0ABN9GDD7_9NEOB|nr:unnamed protein product [Staurois parvus]
MTRECRHSTGDGPETADILQEMTRDCGHSIGEMTRECGHSTGDDQRMRTQYRRWTRDCGHTTGDDQRLRT